MLSGKVIQAEIANKRIKISPFDDTAVGPHSVDLRLGDGMTKMTPNAKHNIIDTRRDASMMKVEPQENGAFLLLPGYLYLGHTLEVIGSDHHVPIIHGRSTAARWGIQVHAAAGFCDVGWHGQVVLEITNLNAWPIILYTGSRICQVEFSRLEGECNLYKSTYQDQRGPRGPKWLV